MKQKDGNASGASSSGAESGHYDDDDEDYDPDKAQFEKRELLLRIPHILMRKVESTSAVDATLQLQKNFIVQCCTYLIKSRSLVTDAYGHNYYTQLLTYLNRVMIIKSDEFVVGIL